MIILNKIFRDVYTGNLFCNVDDRELYRSTDCGYNWELLAQDGSFAWAEDAKGRTHVSYSSQETSYAEAMFKLSLARLFERVSEE